MRRLIFLTCGILLLLFVLVLSGCGPVPSSTSTPGQSSPTQLTTVVARPFHETVKTLDGVFTVTLDITPNRSGPNNFSLRVMDTRTDQPATHIAVTLYTTMQDMAMGTDSVQLRATGAGTFSSASDTLSMAGHWAIGIAIQTSDHAVHKAGVSLLMAT